MSKSPGTLLFVLDRTVLLGRLQYLVNICDRIVPSERLLRSYQEFLQIRSCPIIQVLWGAQEYSSVSRDVGVPLS